MKLNKNIFLLWLQGWDHAPWLQKKVVESWRINNPNWNIHLIDSKNINNYVSDINYINNEFITMQTKADIIRLSLLKNHGGVWADATLLCMQPLEHWIYEAIQPSNFWMYRSKGKYLKLGPDKSPTVWFIISVHNEYIINKWKEECDCFWNNIVKEYPYFFLDTLFQKIFYNDQKFKQLWLKTPNLYSEFDGQSNTIMNHKMHKNTYTIKQLLKNKPPYVLKFSNTWNNIYPEINEECKLSNGYYAIQLSKEGNIYKHKFTNSNYNFKNKNKNKNKYNIMKFSIILTASYIKSHPSIILIKKVIESLKYINVDCLNLDYKISVLLSHDYHDNSYYNKYFENLLVYVDNYNNESNNFILSIIKSKSNGHLTGNIRNCIKYVKSEYLLIIQHDLQFRQYFNINSIIEDMIKYPKLKHIRFNKRQNIKIICDNDNCNFFNNHNIKGNNNYISTLQWSDQNHVTTTKYYKDIILKLCKDGNFMEKTLNKMNNEDTHDFFGTYIYGNLNESKYIKDLDGKNYNEI